MHQPSLKLNYIVASNLKNHTAGDRGFVEVNMIYCCWEVAVNLSGCRTCLSAFLEYNRMISDKCY